MKRLTKSAVFAILAIILVQSTAFATEAWDFVSLGDVDSPLTAVSAVDSQIVSMGAIDSAEDIAYVAAFADEAISRAASVNVDGNEIFINYNTVSEERSYRGDGMTLEETAHMALHETEEKIRERLASQPDQDFREMYRDLFSTVTFRNIGIGELRVYIDPNIRNVNVDTINVETPLYSLSFSPHELGSELNERLVISMNNVSQTMDPEVEVYMSNKHLTTSMTLSLPSESMDLTDMAVMDSSMKAYMTRRNNVTSEAEGKIFGDGTYSVGYNGTDFEDTKYLSDKTKKAIRAMAAKGITTGKTSTTFGPNDPITRGQFVTFLMRCLGVKDSWNGTSRFSDVGGAYYYAYANAAAKYGYISGYSDGTFRPNQPLLKQQICKILGNVLQDEQNVRIPGDKDKWLNKYNDRNYIIPYAQDSVAILTRMGYISPPYFNGEHVVTRAEMAELLYDTLLK